MDKNSNIIERYVNAWNAKNAQDIEGCFHHDGVYIDANLDHEITPSAFSERAKEIFTYFPDLEVQVDQQTLNGHNLATIRWTLVGILKDRVLQGVDVFCIENEKIRSLQVYFSYDTGRLFAKIPSLHLSYQPDQKTQQLARPQQSKKYSTSGLTTEGIQHLKDQLEGIMDNDQIFLDQDISLAKLADALDTTTNHLSQVINSVYSKNFYDFVNAYRIAFAKRLMEENAKDNLSALDIAFECGFKSSSTFYNAFKKETELTPSQFKKSLPNYAI